MKDQTSARAVIHPTAVRRAFGEDAEHRASLVTFVHLDGNVAVLRGLDGTEAAVTVADPDALRAAIERDDVCQLKGVPLVLVNERYRLLGVAVGPSAPPSRLEVLWGVSRIEDGSVVEIPSPDEATQQAWLIFALGEPS